MSFPSLPLKVDILGPMNIILGSDERRVVASAHQRTVLSLLALRTGTPVSAEDLMDELWGEEPPAKARNALQATVTRLRRTIRSNDLNSPSEDIIQTSGTGYTLKLPAEAIDVHRFTHLADTGMRLARSTPTEAIGTLERALGLWRGGALVDAGDGRRCVAAGVKLEEIRMAAQEELLALQIGTGHGQSVLGALKELSVQFPERERICELLMTALCLAGRQVEALNEFHRLRRWLSRELGLEPGYRLHRLYSHILQGGTRSPQDPGETCLVGGRRTETVESLVTRSEPPVLSNSSGKDC